MVEIAEPADGATQARLRSSYLEALEANEELERSAVTRVGELGALVDRLSRALPECADAALVKQLEQLGATLKSRPLDARLSSDVGAAHARLLDLIAVEEREHAALLQALGRATDRLESLARGWRLKRRLKRFRRLLGGRDTPPPAPLVEALVELQGATLDGLGAAAPDEDPPRDDTRPRDHSPDPGEPLAEQPDWEAIRQVLVSLVERIELPAALDAQARTVAARLESDLGEQTLIEVLESLRELIDASLASVQVEYQSFLDAVDRELATVLRSLGSVREAEAADIASGTGLAESMQARLSAMREEASQATGLEQLKGSIGEHLQSLAQTVNEFRARNEHRGVERDRNFSTMAERLGQLESETREMREQLEAQRRLALSDSLTGLPNRQAFDERLDEAVAARARYGTPLALAIADIDHFKRVNDEHGHQAGDRALALFSGLLRKRLRRADFCARYGGEEFVVLMTNTGVGEAATLVEQIRATVEACSIHHKGAPVPLTVSFGVTALGEHDTADAALGRADEALYAAKAAGRNRVEIR